MKNIILNFKEMNMIKKCLSILGVIFLIALFVFGIIFILDNKLHYYGQLLLISVFSVPVTIWSYSGTFRDIACTPDLLKIKNSVETEKRVDAYVDYMLEKNFSLFAPIVCLGMTIASFYIYTSSVKGMLDSHISYSTFFFVLFQMFNIGYVLYLLVFSILDNLKNKNKLIFRLFTLSFLIGSIIASFYNETTLLVLTTSLVIGFSFNKVSNLFAKRKKIEEPKNLEEMHENKENNLEETETIE